METAGFIVGLSGVITVVEKSLERWQSLAATREFGSDLTAIVAKLSMEYYRFSSWARISGALQMPASSKQKPGANHQSVGNPIGAPIEDVVAQVALILEDIRALTAKYTSSEAFGINSGSGSKTSSRISTPSLALGLNTTLPLSGVQHNPGVDTFNRETSFRLRFTFSSKPWGSAKKHTLEEKVNQLSYWNDRLENLLPHAVRDSLTNQGLCAHVLIDEDKNILDTLIEASKNDNGGVRTHAQLWKEKIDFSASSDVQPINIEPYRREASVLVDLIDARSSRCAIALRMYQETQSKGGSPMPVAVEWYSHENLNWDINNVRLATYRLAELVHLSSKAARPKSLCVLDSICFIEGEGSLAIVHRLPKNTNITAGAVSLHNMLKRTVSDFRPPDLDKRLHLAQQLVSSVYSFGLVRWFHKDFKCHNVVFFRDNSSPPKIIFDTPFVTGFSISRPDSQGQKSLNVDLDARTIYLHPDLRVRDVKNRPEYHRKYEMYSLGVILFEIGVWATVDKVIDSTLDADAFKKEVVKRATKDLGFYAGPSYRNIVLSCLKCADKDSDMTASSLDTLYWSVVLEIAKLG
ncbi:prion-inhibition and propagation-domain-containing protein [Xylaria telfairii]|nr:prion-inhibition and propagation-domain-containing protein [Xylaria telfairii]